MATTVSLGVIALPVVSPLVAAAILALAMALVHGRGGSDGAVRRAPWALVLPVINWLPALAMVGAAVAVARLPDAAAIPIGSWSLGVGAVARVQSVFAFGAGAFIAALGAASDRGPATAIAAVIASSSIVIGAVAGDDARVGAAGIHVAVLVTAMVMATAGTDGTAGRSGWRAATTYLTLASLGLVILLAGFSLADILRISPGGLVTEAFAIAVLAVGFALAIGLVPLHFWVPVVSLRSGEGGAMLALGLVAPATVGFLVQVLSGLPQLGSEVLTARLLVIGGLLGCAGGAIGAVAPGRLGRRVGYAVIAGLGPVLLGIGSGTRIGVAGALVALAHHATCMIVLVGSAAALEGRPDRQRPAGASRRAVQMAFVLAAIASSGIPPLGGFAARWAVMQALSLADWRLAMAVGVSSLVVLAGLLVGASRWPGDRPETPVEGDLGSRPQWKLSGSAWVLLASTVAACALSVLPSPVLDQAHRATAQLTYLRPF